MSWWIGEGICLVGHYGQLACGAWVLTHRGEAALVETPPSDEDGADAASQVEAVLAQLKARPTCLLFTHNHWDHTLGYKHFRRRFPRARSIVHRSMTRERWKGPFDEIFDEDELVIEVGGEPLVLLHAPKHSPHDTLILFRGVALTGDWALGPFPDANGSVSPREKMRSLARVRSWLIRHDYHIHTAVSAHGNEVRRGIDFIDLLDEMHSYWGESR